MTRRLRTFAILAIALLTVLVAAPTGVQGATTRSGPKVVLIVGPVGSATAYYRQLADQAAAAAVKLTPNVVKVYSPDATWERVKVALEGASIVVYLGHGNGWPSIYRDSLYPPTQNGFGLNPHAGAADAYQYFGEAAIASQIHLAPNALVVFSHLCYASGNTEPGLAEGTLDQAQQRVDNYAAGFFAAGARAVIADAYLAPRYYVTSVLRGKGSVESIWRNAPNRNGNFLSFASVRTKGAIAEMDPEQVSSGFYRSIVLKPRLTSREVLGGAPTDPPIVDPILEPSLVGLGVTFGAPDLSAPPTAGSSTQLELPMTRDATALLPGKLLVGTRWDRLDRSAAAGPAAAPAGAAAASRRITTAAPSSSPPRPAAAAASDPAPGPPDLVTPEVPGDLVAPVPAKRLAAGGLAAPVRVPATPGLYRLVATLHDPDGLAYDAATQALVPALVVRVTGPVMATYDVTAPASAVAGRAVAVSVVVANVGRTAWGHAAVVPGVGAEREPASRATLVARWVSLGADLPAGAGSVASAILPAALAPGATSSMRLTLTAPGQPGDYLVVLDVVDPGTGSLAAQGVPPGMVRIAVGG